MLKVLNTFSSFLLLPTLNQLPVELPVELPVASCQAIQRQLVGSQLLAVPPWKGRDRVHWYRQVSLGESSGLWSLEKVHFIMGIGSLSKTLATRKDERRNAYPLRWLELGNLEASNCRWRRKQKAKEAPTPSREGVSRRSKRNAIPRLMALTRRVPFLALVCFGGRTWHTIQACDKYSTHVDMTSCLEFLLKVDDL